MYWNSDSTNVSAASHNFLLRELYLNNKLVQDKGVKNWRRVDRPQQD
ncbi:hypothetical protein QW180_29715 [Vibrio sinaloensis]|nr:hypothetical protein [Vibrio sinaloensis]